MTEKDLIERMDEMLPRLHTNVLAMLLGRCLASWEIRCGLGEVEKFARNILLEIEARKRPENVA